MGTPTIFCAISCLSEDSHSFSVDELSSKWFTKGDKRLIDRTVQDFLILNNSFFNFIGVTPIVTGSYKDMRLSFRSSSYVGAIPLKSPDDGKPFADFIVYPKYINNNIENVNEYIEIIYMLEKEIKLEFKDSCNLLSKDQARPPIYYECVKYLELLVKATKKKWVKFNSSIEINNYPRNQISWGRYIKQEWDPVKKLEYPCKINELNQFHSEMLQLFHVYYISKNHILNHETPISIRKPSIKKGLIIENFFSSNKPIFTDKLTIHNNDPYLIKQTKEQANKILGYDSQVNIAWRIDFTDIFEKYIQYIFRNISERLGWKILNNPKYRSNADSHPTWSLQYLEPDLVLYKDGNSVMIDAKYKAHYYNMNSSSEYLKQEHRNDLHQIAAYCAFESNQKKVGIICYPSSYPDSKKMVYKNIQSSNDISVYFFGIPITSKNINAVIEEVQSHFIKLIDNEKLFVYEKIQ